MSNKWSEPDDYRDQFPSLNNSSSDDDLDLNSFSNHIKSKQNQDLRRSEAARRSASGRRKSGTARTGGASRRKKKKTGKKRGPLAKVGRAILVVFLVGLITGSLVVGTFAVYVFGFVDDTLDDDLNELKMDFTTTLYVKDTTTGDYVEYQRLHGEQNRIWISIDQMPEDLVNAYIAIEDKRFLSHNGVDWKRTISAFANMFVHIYSSNQGGSTITQQLVKNLTGDSSQTPMRKIREIMRARYVEKNYSKETIMECYLNTIAMANGIYGVEVASNYYFNKSASQLDIAECATLAAMAKEPERYRPDTNPEDNKERRMDVLYEMHEQGLITDEEYDQAVNEDVVITASDENIKETTANSWFVDTVIDQVIDDLMDQYGYDETYASNRFYNGGFKIYCTLDTNIQSVLDTTYTDASNFAKATSSKDPSATVQSAMTVMDYEGHILGIVGGRGEKTGVRELNRAYNVARQPGSTMKPIAVYAPALEANLITYSTKEEDEPIQTTIDGKLTSWPKNSGGSYGGSTTVANALERSLNTVPVRILQDLTVSASYDFLTNKLGITTLDETNDMNLSALALGGTYGGLTPTELTAAFATFGNNGKYYEPTTYTKITDQYDEVVLEQGKSTIAMGEDTANIMNKLLQNVVYGSNGTGTAAKFGTLPIYGKTGTTSDNYDRWFVGGTPYYIAACWYGFDTPATLKVSGNPALNVWKKVMEQINEGKADADFPQSDSVVYARYCTTSGMLATTNCPSTAYGWFKTSYLPACTTHGGTLLDFAASKPSGVTSTYTGSTSSKIKTTTSTTVTTSEEETSSEAGTSSESTVTSEETTTSAHSTSSADTGTVSDTELDEAE